MKHQLINRKITFGRVSLSRVRTAPNIHWQVGEQCLADRLRCGTPPKPSVGRRTGFEQFCHQSATLYRWISQEWLEDRGFFEKH